MNDRLLGLEGIKQVYINKTPFAWNSRTYLDDDYLIDKPLLEAQDQATLKWVMEKVEGIENPYRRMSELPTTPTKAAKSLAFKEAIQAVLNIIIEELDLKPRTKLNIKWAKAKPYYPK